jgi:hypothetical protein
MANLVQAEMAEQGTRCLSTVQHLDCYPGKHGPKIAVISDLLSGGLCADLVVSFGWSRG